MVLYGPGFAAHGRGVQLDDRLIDILTEAANGFGYQVRFNSGVAGRAAGTRNHPTGRAIDISLIDPAGHVLGNLRDPASFPAYEAFAKRARAIQQQKYPELTHLFGWGGYFGPGRGNRSGFDMMHFDLSGTRGRYGTFETGLNDAGQRALYGRSMPEYAQAYFDPANPQTPAQQAAAAEAMGGNLPAPLATPQQAAESVRRISDTPSWQERFPWPPHGFPNMAGQPVRQAGPQDQIPSLPQNMNPAWPALPAPLASPGPSPATPAPGAPGSPTLAAGWQNDPSGSQYQVLPGPPPWLHVRPPGGREWWQPILPIDNSGFGSPTPVFWGPPQAGGGGLLESLFARLRR